ncbi:hypothetical protein SAMN05192529_106142 [Arachidicoccus rhizosphaerae]|uniref:Long-chain fatty acid transport protein n=1 Tax=Arachidicoccus rhizosphaerae TaxID=551991 RepID=A0A1H3XXF2_9BACT|nr:hypothetical protein [Arachidicoccus rhizosphaerae]SEA03188.1 hypothetical protein SAMN05192529_106142 [Arachidicoccus rhizosphaerae]
MTVKSITYKSILFPCLSALCLSVGQKLHAQTNTSVYSMLGIGNIRTDNYDYGSGMGGATQSLRDGRYILESNPAALPFLDDHFFAIELNGTFQSINYTGNAIKTPIRSNQSQFQRFAMATKFTKWWGGAWGLKQYSSSNYSLYGEKNIIGTSDYITTYYEGTGGLNEVYFSNGWRLGNNFSLGLKSSYIFGNMTQTEYMYTANYIGTQLNTANRLFYQGFNFTGGLQYQGNISDKIRLGLGVTATKKTTLTGDRSLSMSSGDPDNGAPTNIIADSSLGNTKFSLPDQFGGGISLTYDRTFTLASDYRYGKWEDVGNSTNGYNYGYNNSSQLSFGLSYSPRKVFMYNGQYVEMEKYRLQAGAYFNTDYVNMYGQQILDKGVTLGLGVFSRRSSLSYLINFQYGSRGTTVNNLIKENYFKLGVTLSYRDLWKKRRYN